MEMKKTAAKKTAAKKTKLNRICDLVDCYIDEEITKNELVDKLVRLVGKPIITISEMEYTVYENTENFIAKHSEDYGWLFLCSRERKAGSDWVDVTDLTELKVWEYNLLVEKLNIHYPHYPIETLEGRFV
tara:strand:- start:2297 stop:2686 length:390 start_codon:yes stop_codon:yes gene_type:complete